MILRKTGAVIAVGALVLASILAGSTAAYAAVPAAPTIDQTFAPWITTETTATITGTADDDVSSITITDQSDVYTGFFCSTPMDPGPGTTTWSCTPGTPSLSLGDNHLTATATNIDGTSVASSEIVIKRIPHPNIDSPADGVYTNNTQPTFSGTADDSLGYIDLVSSVPSNFCTAVPIVAGHWSCTASAPIPDGDWSYQISNTSTGAIGTLSQIIHIDTVLSPPNTDIDGPPGSVDGSGELHSASTDPTPTITGTAEPFATITMWQNYSQIGCQGGAPVADLYGAWSCTLAVALPTSGIYIFGSQQTDPAGNTNTLGSPDEQLELTYTDTTPPAPPVVTSPIGNVFAGMNVVTTNSMTPTVTGTGEPGATLDIFGNSCMITPTYVDSGGNWTCQLTTPMTPDGDYDVYFGLTDAALNSSALASPFIRFSVDTVPPPTPTVSTPSGPSVGGVIRATTQSGHVVITGSGEIGDTVHIYVGGSTPVSCTAHPVSVDEGGQFACTVSATLSPGVYYYGFSATDKAGNSSGSPVTRLRLEVLSPPALPTLGLSWFLKFATDSDDPAPGQNISFSGSDLPPGATVTAELHSTPTNLGSSTVQDDGTFVLNTVIPNTVEPGQHTYIVTVTPLKGDSQTSEMPVTIVAAPPVVIPEPAPPADPNGGGTGSGAGSDSGSGSGSASGPAQRNKPAAPNQLSHALPTVQSILANPIVVGAAAASSLALLFLVAFPAEILNSTLDENYERIFGKLPKARLPWLDRLRKRLKKTPVVGGLALTTLAALILSFADPHFGFDLASLRLFLACAIGMFVLGFVANAVTGIVIRRRWSITSVIELQPFGLVVALLGVILSRVLDFAPGLLVGLVLALSLSASATLKEESRAVITWAGVILGLSIVSWIIYSIIAGETAPGTFTGALVDDSLVAIATEGVSGLIIGLLPIGFLDGRQLFKNSRWQWVITYMITLVAFFTIVVPSGALWGGIDGPFWVWLAVLVAFAAVCVGVYWWFRAHPETESDAASDSADGEGSRANVDVDPSDDAAVTGSRQTKSLHT